jgi:hypothetical protein
MSDMGIAGSADKRFAAEVFAATDLAMTGSDFSAHHLDLAGVPVLLEFANERTRSLLLPALRHLEDPPSAAPQPDVVLQVWDSNSTGVPMPPPPVPRHDFTHRGDIAGFGTSRQLVAFHWHDFSVCLLDRDAGRGVLWVQDPGNMPYWSRSAPLRTLLHWVLMDRGMHLVHAAMVGDAHSGVLLVGGGGSGKSSTAIRCLADGMTYLGDDYVAVATDPPRAYSLYSTAKLYVGDPRPAGRPLMSPAPNDEKVVLELGEHDTQLRRRLPISAIATLRFCEQDESDLEEVDSATLMTAAIFTTLAQLPHAGAPLHRLMQDLVAQVATMRVRLGRDPDSVVSAIREIVSGQPTIHAAIPEALPLISVVIPVHNGARFIADAVASVLAQEYAALELIVVDDGSTDELDAAVANLPVAVEYLRQPQQGPAAARNAGIARARGEVLAFLDVDDLWPPNVLEILLDVMLNQGSDVVTGWAQMALYDDTNGTTTSVGVPEVSFPHYIGAALYRRSAFDAVGLFDPGLQYGEDTDWFKRLQESDQVLRRIPLTTLVVRRHGANMTRGKNPVELGVVRTVKKSLDRRRLRDG